MPEENAFDRFSKRLAVAVSRRSLLRSLSLAVAGVLLPWRKASADLKNPTSAELETKFFAAPVLLKLINGAQVNVRCIASVAIKNSSELAIGATSAPKESECPTEISRYFENTDLVSDFDREAIFDESKLFNVKNVKGQSRLLKTFPIATSYSFINPATGKQEFEAFCSAFTYLDPRVHKGEPDRKMIHYKRMPTPEKLTSLDDDVTCGDINYAYENEIKTRKPIALRDFTVDAVPHQASAKRVNATGTSASNHSGHKSK